MRLSKDEYFINIANATSKLGTCDRKQVGCVLVKNNHIVATGYNGSISGTQHCDDIGHDLIDNHCVKSIHAEANSICSASKLGHSTDGATAYINIFPCWKCFQLLISAGIKEIVYQDDYKIDARIQDAINERIIAGKEKIILRKIDIIKTPISQVKDLVEKYLDNPSGAIKNKILDELNNIKENVPKELIELIGKSIVDKIKGEK